MQNSTTPLSSSLFTLAAPTSPSPWPSTISGQPRPSPPPPTSFFLLQLQRRHHLYITIFGLHHHFTAAAT
ncbi:putative proline-rich receptor-like protein kinase PERK13 [Iris pallida]|uniref:Proline-rich receptor-like protein kinase PERK13 n=1 Tax=Iris pallida TaxID=29817 RepID=A0AAX6EKR7_IRIPA|nr:putative proline-rich receptor-like protein kinase PERK13 [Iris pallida]